MQKKTKVLEALTPQEDLLLQLKEHYTNWTEDNQQRMSRKGGWNEVTDAYFGRLPEDWPYLSRVVDPRVRTTLLEKNARLLNGKLRGRLVPREGGDVLKARINNALLDFQWDTATNGGSMLSKWAQMDLDTRLYSSKFALVKWRYEKNAEGEVVFDGNEFQPLDIRDCGIDFTASHIKDAKWFQHREWVKIEDLERVCDSTTGKPMYNLAKIKEKMSSQTNDRRDSAYFDRVKQLQGLKDRTGTDKSFPVLELVTEYRKDRWITFSPRFNEILRDIKNPYEHGKIPIVQLRYYPIGDDPIGQSEVEPVLPIWRGIQAVVCGFIDYINIHMRPPVKVLEGGVKMETIQYGPEAVWVMTRPDSIQEFQGGGEQIAYFQTTYGSLVSAFSNAMGDLSQGTSAIDPFATDKTATEVKQSVRQQNVRDQNNQMYLAEAIQDMMQMWLSNNKQFLFTDKTKGQYLLKVLGNEMYAYFKQSGLDEMEVTPEAMQAIGDIIEGQEGNVSDGDIQQLIDAGATPKYPVFENPNEKDPSKLKFKPKMTVSQQNDSADLYIVPEDLQGTYDYIADVRSMSSGADMAQQEARMQAVETLTGNPVVLQLLQQEGFRPNIKDALVAQFEDAGYKDASRFFTQINAATPAQTIDPTAAGQAGLLAGQPQVLPGSSPNLPVAPGQGGLNTAPPAANFQQMG